MVMVSGAGRGALFLRIEPPRIEEVLLNAFQNTPLAIVAGLTLAVIVKLWVAGLAKIYKRLSAIWQSVFFSLWHRS